MDQSFPVKLNNKLKRWGDFEDGSDKKTEVQPDEIILSDEKVIIIQWFIVIKHIKT